MRTPPKNIDDADAGEFPVNRDAPTSSDEMTLQPPAVPDAEVPEFSALETALQLVKEGHKVFPCGQDKKPLTKHGFKDASSDPEVVCRWWQKWPDALIGLPTGVESGISVVDLDLDAEKDKDGITELGKLQTIHGNASETFAVRTPRGGFHLYYKHRDGFKCSTDKIARGIDTRGDGGYVIYPSQGSGYKIEKNLPLADLPEWVYQAIAKRPDEKRTSKQSTADKTGEHRKQTGRAGETDILSALDQTDPDCGYQVWVEIGQSLHSWDTDRGFVLWDDWSRKGKKYHNTTRTHWNSFNADGGITVGTLFHHAKQAGWKPSESQAADPIAAAKAGAPWPMTDAGNAERFAYYSKDSLVFDTRKESWRHYNGKKWVEDKGENIYKSAIKVVRSIRFEEAKHCPRAEEGRDLGKQLFKHSIDSEAKPRLEAMLSLARHMMAHSDFDSDKYLFNCGNGTIELKTGKLREHSREDYITRSSPVVYDPVADCIAWNNFLNETLQGDMDMVRFLQINVGYCLSGDASEEILNLVHGPEATGKSTFMESVKSAFGDYTKTCDFETFLKQKDSGRPRNDLASLDGARLVSSCEVEEGKELAENVVKILTGGDTISARFLYKEFFEYEPQFKLWLICNHVPKVDAQDGAMWRRILRIPFVFTIPKERRDKKLKKMLKDPAIGGVQILKWAVEGFLFWQAEGLQIPAVVEKSTQEYRESCDFLADFFNESCDLSDPSAWMSTEQIYRVYKNFCMKNDIKHPMNMISFSKKLEGRGLKKQKQDGVRGWLGICPASKMDAMDRLDTSSTKCFIEPPKAKFVKHLSNVSNLSTDMGDQ